MNLKNNFKEFWKLNGKNYLWSMLVLTLVGAFFIQIKQWGLHTYLSFPPLYCLGFIMSFGLSAFLEDE